jgi:hypothetical protein
MLGAGIAAVMATLALASPAWAQTPFDVAEQVSQNGYYVAPGASADEANLAELTRRMQERGYNFGSVVLADDLGGDEDFFAEEVAALFNESVTIVIVTPAAIGYSSGDFSVSELDEAAAGSIDAFDIDPADGFIQFADFLVPGVAAGNRSGGSGFPWGLVFIVGVLVVIVFMVLRRQGKVQNERRAEDIREARAEIKHQLDEIANEILDDEDSVRLSENQQAKDYFQAASDTYANALEQFEEAQRLSALEGISDKLDEARWQLAASDALREGKEVPPQPEKDRRATCFFDPAHPPATEKAILKTSAGEREVLVCPPDAARLRQGEQPSTRQINVGGRPIPAPMAPKSYGGGGFGMMDFFQVILGSMAASGGFGGTGRARPHARRHQRYTRNREIMLPELGSASGRRRTSTRQERIPRRRQQASGRMERKRSGRMRRR